MGKKVQDLVKGIVITGTAIGGASVFSNTGMAYVHAYTSDGTEETYEVTGGGGESQEAPSENSGTENTYEGSGGTEGQEGAGTEGAVGQEGSAEGTEGTGAPTAEGQEGSGTEGTEGQEGSVEGAGEGTDVPGTPAVTNENQEGEPEDTPVITASKAQTRSLGATRRMATLAAAPAQQTPDPATPDPATPAASEMTDEEIYASNSTSLSEEEELLLSTSASESESLESTENSLSTGIVNAQSEYNSQLEAYNSLGYNNSGLSQAESEIASLEALSSETVDGKGHVTLSSLDYYKNVGRPLALAMIKYNMLLEGTIDSTYAFNETDIIDPSGGSVSWKFYDGGYDLKHFCLKFVDTNNNYQERYFDYVTIKNDQEGTSIIKPNANQNYTGDYADEVYGINVLEKTPVYNSSQKQLKVYIDVDGHWKNVKGIFTITDENFNAITDENGNPKTVNVYQRTSFENDSERRQKGLDYYTHSQCGSNVTERSELSDALSNLTTEIKSLTSQLSEVVSSASASMIDSASASTARAGSLSASADASTSASTQKSDSLSTSKSESAASASASESAANSASTASSESSSVSASESASVASSQSASTSASIKASESESASVSDSESTLGSESITISNVASDYRADVTNRINTDNAVRDNYSGNVVLRPIDNNEIVPLAVLDDFVGGEDLGTIPDNVDVITGIEDGDVAKFGEMGQNTWLGVSLPVIGGLTSLFGIGKLKKEEKNNKK